MSDFEHFFLYLPVEIASRDTTSYINLIETLKDKNLRFTCVIGDQDQINSGLELGLLPCGIVIQKSAQLFRLNRFRNIKSNSYVQVLSLAESVIVFRDKEHNDMSRAHSECLKHFDAVFSVNAEDKSHLINLLSKLNEASRPKIYLIGGFRYNHSITKPIINFKNKRELKKRILWLTNFGPWSSINGFDEKGWKRYARDNNVSDFQTNMYMQFANWKLDITKLILSSLRYFFDANDDWFLSVRPHPSDNHEFIEQILKNNGIEFQVSNEFDITKDILLSDKIIAETTTSALEASLAGIPPLMPWRNTSFSKQWIKQLASTKCSKLFKDEDSFKNAVLASNKDGDVERARSIAKTAMGLDIDTAQVFKKFLKTLDNRIFGQNFFISLSVRLLLIYCIRKLYQALVFKRKFKNNKIDDAILDRLNTSDLNFKTHMKRTFLIVEN